MPRYLIERTYTVDMDELPVTPDDFPLTDAPS